LQTIHVGRVEIQDHYIGPLQSCLFWPGFARERIVYRIGACFQGRTQETPHLRLMVYDQHNEEQVTDCQLYKPEVELHQ